MKEIWLALIPATIPTLTVLVGILLNQTGLSKLEGRLTARIDHLQTRLDHLEIRIDRIEATVNARLDGLSKQLNEAVVMLMGRDTEKAERLAKLEERTSKS